MSFFHSLLGTGGSGGVSGTVYDAIVVFQWSQSNGGAPNSVQEADLPVELQGNQAAKLYDHSTAALNGTGTWSTYRVGVNCNQPNVDTDGVGPDAKFIHELAQLYPNKIYLIKWAPGGIGLKDSAVTPNYNVNSVVSGGFDHYKKFVFGQVEQALLALRINEQIGHRRIFIACTDQIQGEEDAKNSDAGTYYYPAQVAFVNGLLTMLADKGYDTTYMDYIIHRTHNNLPVETFPYINLVQTAQVQFAANYKTENPTKKINNIHVIDTNSYETISDFTHHSEAGVIQAGADAFATQSARDFTHNRIYVANTNAAQDVLWYVENRGGGIISEGWKTKMATFIDTLGSEWYKLTSFICAINNETLSTVDWAGNANNGSGLITNNGAVFVADSHWDLNGTSHYLDIGLRPNNSLVNNYNKKFLQNDAEFGVYVKQNDDKTTAIRALFGLQATRHFTIIQQPASNRIIGYANDITLLAYNNAADDFFNDNSLYSLVRSGAGARAIYRGETSLASDTTASTGLDGGYSMIVGAKNGSSLSQYFDGQVRCAYMGAALNRAIFVPALTALLS